MTPPKENSKTERPPIIAIMGHIDHGKSTLLDYIRKSNIVGGEAGGITQHISAYEVVHKDKNGNSKKITFLDTPGHEAFSKMRDRGAKIADIGILIVSAEEGVKAQTIEAYKSIEQSKTPFIIAINKIDRPNANIERCKQELAEAGILVEGYGGSIPFTPISAKTGEGVPELLDMMLLVAEMEELAGDQNAPAEGFVLEANLDPKSGVTATFVIKNGTLKTGDFVIVGNEMAKLKKIENFLGVIIKEATFSAPVRVYGFSNIPEVGSCFTAFPDKKEAEKFLEEMKTKPASCQKSNGNYARNVLQVEIPIIIKSDVYGTLEALEKEIAKLSTDKVAIRVISTGVGAITENDVKTASSSSNSIIVGFHVKTDKTALDLKDRYGIQIMTFDIIYKLSEWLEEQVKERTPKEKTEETIGRAKILKAFSRVKDKQVVGGTVTFGIIARGKDIRILRRDVEIGGGHILDLQEQKIRVSQVGEGLQFGTEIDAKLQIAPGDVIETFEITYK